VLTNILLLEDDVLLGESLQDLLEEEGVGVTLCPNGQEALNATFAQQFDLYILDINVPLIDGITLLKELRASNDETPALFLTSHKESDVLHQAYENGADDYLKKPFDTSELLLRIKALLRRKSSTSKQNCVGELCVDSVHKMIFYQGIEISFSPKEYQLMLLFINNIDKVVTKEMIVNELWSPSQDPSDGAIRVYINRLKHEIGNDRIVNVRGMGYRLVS
jgi:DNA-binding response OmpR family regulator